MFVAVVISWFLVIKAFMLLIGILEVKIFTLCVLFKSILYMCCVSQCSSLTAVLEKYGRCPESVGVCRHSCVVSRLWAAAVFLKCHIPTFSGTYRMQLHCEFVYMAGPSSKIPQMFLTVWGWGEKCTLSSSFHPPPRRPPWHHASSLCVCEMSPSFTFTTTWNNIRFF